MWTHAGTHILARLASLLFSELPHVCWVPLWRGRGAWEVHVLCPGALFVRWEHKGQRVSSLLSEPPVAPFGRSLPFPAVWLCPRLARFIMASLGGLPFAVLRGFAEHILCAKHRAGVKEKDLHVGALITSVNSSLGEWLPRLSETQLPTL